MPAFRHAPTQLRLHESTTCFAAANNYATAAFAVCSNVMLHAHILFQLTRAQATYKRFGGCQQFGSRCYCCVQHCHAAFANHVLAEHMRPTIGFCRCQQFGSCRCCCCCCCAQQRHAACAHLVSAEHRQPTIGFCGCQQFASCRCCCARQCLAACAHCVSAYQSTG